MADINITSNINEVEVYITHANTRALTKAARRSIDRASEFVRSQLVREIKRERYINMTIANLKKRLRRDGNFKTPGMPLISYFARVQASNRAEYMHTFFPKTQVVRTARGKRQAVRVSIFGKSYVTGAFLVAGKTRVKRPGAGVTFLRRLGKDRLKLKRLYGPSVSDMIRKTSILSRIEHSAGERFAKEMATNVRFYLDDSKKAAKLR
jgi:hypothetical protein